MGWAEGHVQTLLGLVGFIVNVATDDIRNGLCYFSETTSPVAVFLVPDFHIQ